MIISEKKKEREKKWYFRHSLLRYSGVLQGFLGMLHMINNMCVMTSCLM